MAAAASFVSFFFTVGVDDGILELVVYNNTSRVQPRRNENVVVRDEQ